MEVLDVHSSPMHVGAEVVQVRFANMHGVSLLVRPDRDAVEVMRLWFAGADDMIGALIQRPGLPGADERGTARVLPEDLPEVFARVAAMRRVRFGEFGGQRYA